MKTTHVILLAILAAAFAACGQKGPLFLEPEKLPLPLERFQAAQMGQAIRISMGFPLILSDGLTDLETAKVSKITVFYSDKEIAAEKFKKKAPFIKKFAMSEAKRQLNDLYVVNIPFKTKELDKKKYFFAAQYSYGKKTSTLSSIVAVETLIPPKPISDLAAKLDGKVVALRWSKPTLNAVNGPLAEVGGYKVFRKIAGDEAENDFSQLGIDPIFEEYFEDNDTSREGQYVYTVSTFISDRVESEPSNEAALAIKDVFSPDVPVNLVAFTGVKHIFLSWESSKDRDLSHYRVYRKQKKDEDLVLFADNIKETFFRDTKVKKGDVYIYAVSAVDDKGNESEMSETVRHTFE